MNQREFQAGDAVVYAAEGVCTVEEIQQREFRGTSTSYYVLQPYDLGIDRGDVVLMIEEKLKAGE